MELEDEPISSFELFQRSIFLQICQNDLLLKILTNLHMWHSLKQTIWNKQQINEKIRRFIFLLSVSSQRALKYAGSNIQAKKTSSILFLVALVLLQNERSVSGRCL